MSWFLVLVIVGFAAFIVGLGYVSVRTLVEDARARRAAAIAAPQRGSR